MNMQLELDIEKAIRDLETAHSARISQERRQRYVKKLAQLGDHPALWRALDKAQDDDRMPNPAALHAAVHAEIDRVEKQSRTERKLRPLSPTERAAADDACVASCIWLHLVKQTPAAWFAGSVFARMLKRAGVTRMHPRDIQEFFNAEIAREGWTAETIDRWMQAEKAKGN